MGRLRPLHGEFLRQCLLTAKNVRTQNQLCDLIDLDAAEISRLVQGHYAYEDYEQGLWKHTFNDSETPGDVAGYRAELSATIRYLRQLECQIGVELRPNMPLLALTFLQQLHFIDAKGAATHLLVSWKTSQRIEETQVDARQYSHTSVRSAGPNLETENPADGAESSVLDDLIARLQPTTSDAELAEIDVPSWTQTQFEDGHRQLDLGVIFHTFTENLGGIECQYGATVAYCRVSVDNLELSEENYRNAESPNVVFGGGNRWNFYGPKPKDGNLLRGSAFHDVLCLAKPVCEAEAGMCIDVLVRKRDTELETSSNVSTDFSNGQKQTIIDRVYGIYINKKANFDTEHKVIASASLAFE